MKFVSPQGKIDLSEWTFDTPALDKEFLAAIEIALTEIVSEASLSFAIQLHGPAVKDPSMLYMSPLLDYDNEGVRLEFSLRKEVENFIEFYEPYGGGPIDSDFIEPAKALRDEFRAIADLIDEKLSI